MCAVLVYCCFIGGGWCMGFYGFCMYQILIAVTLSICSLSDGFIFGQMSGMIDALRSNDTSIPVTEEDISWIASTINVLCLFGFALTGTLADILGRRKTITILSIPVTACWIFIYFIQDKILLLITRIVLGVCYGGILGLIFMCVVEYQPPKIRPISLNLITNVGALVGTTLGHVLSLLINWRYVALIGIIPSGVSAILPFFWVESPPWLASKGKYEEAEDAFKALRLSDETTNNQLKLLLSCEKKKYRDVKINAPKTVVGKKILLASKQGYFWKILVLGTVICVYRVASGRILFVTLAITMLQDITGTSDILLFTLTVDGFTIVGSLLSTFFLLRFKIRDLLFTSGIIANFILIVFALCLYFLTDNDSYSSWIKVVLLALYFVTLTAGPYPVLDTVLAEIFPIHLKSFYFISIGIVCGTLQFLSVKFVPDMLRVIGYHGIFLVHAAVVFFCISYLWFTMPETKGRSIHEIEYYFKNNSFNYNQELCTLEQNEFLNEHRMQTVSKYLPKDK